MKNISKPLTGLSFRFVAVLFAAMLTVGLIGCAEPAPPPPSQPAQPAPPSSPTVPPPPAQPPATPPATPVVPETPDKAASPAVEPKPGDKLLATLETSKGTIQFELFTKDAPKTTENFRLLANRGFYKNVTFHRVINGFMIQGGDPTGTGAGGQSAFGGDFADEINASSPLYQTGYKRGIVAMANRGPNTNGSQFFIMHKDYPLSPNYTIFGRVVKGQDVVDAIATTQTAQDRPVTPIVIRDAKVEVVK